MNYEIVSLNVGQPQLHQFGGQEIHTGFVKRPTTEVCYLTMTGFCEDGQADLKNHGGEEKALLMYAEDHYTYWESLYKLNFTYPSFGENITVKGLTEKDLYIGDIFQLGEAFIQVSQPRQPCYKIAAYHQIRNIPAEVTRTGFSGYYFRVLKEGKASSRDKLIKVEESESRVTPYDIFDCLFHQRENKEKMKQYVDISTLSANVKSTFKKRLMKLG
ncbi:MOSC domain-containing protein YiiM [Gracilibacillus ureilyticus]|uniref:MOSC domain-containing protein YiiM n=1 Tax=Gracilibacillus ureilyticus TaxID=531814 RepID=A0A1H9QAP6_9BACI|nr:MOSC domain-containing protein [Gracilibacillus ureilyticus]SER57626.1 MOSC domain-containing protein YiiM [Gracilibacillus ureilyticus]